MDINIEINERKDFIGFLENVTNLPHIVIELREEYYYSIVSF